MLESQTWQTLSEAYAFLGNSLLAPMSQTSSAGLDPAFWEAFPDFDDDGVAQAARECATCARGFAELEESEAVERVSVEYTRLFVGPPKPAAASWETFYRAEDVSVGFGQATFEMRKLLRAWGLELRVPNRQYEDHLGIELLLLSEMCRRAGEEAQAGVRDVASDGAGAESSIAAYLDAHPLAWAGKLRDAVAEAASHGYFDNLLGVAIALMTWHARQFG